MSIANIFKRRLPLTDGPSSKDATFPEKYIALVHDELVDRFVAAESDVKAGKAESIELSISGVELDHLKLTLAFKLNTDPTIGAHLPDFDDSHAVVLSEDAARYLVDVLSWPRLAPRGKALVEAVESVSNDASMKTIAHQLRRMDFNNPTAWGIGLGIELTLKALGKIPEDVIGPNDRRWGTGELQHPAQAQRG